MVSLFFLLSGEFETLSFSELKAILAAEDCNYEIIEKLDQTVRLTADVQSVDQVKRRSAYTRVCALELFTCNASDKDIVKVVGETDFQEYLGEGDSFEVRIRRIKEYSTKDDTMRLERQLGKLILERTQSTNVNLRKPDKSFYGILTNYKLVFGIRLAEIQPKPFVERRPRKKPFFHPSAMNAKLARCMVNLAQARTGDLVLDPFCGTGTTVMEAALIGCRSIGADVQRRMISGAERNLCHFGLNAEALIVADARVLPFTGVDCVVTDPPYGKSATTLKSNTKAMVEGVLKSAYAMLKKGQRICIALPIRVNQQGQVDHMSKDLAGFVKGLGFKTTESHLVYCHRSLTREIMVYEKAKQVT